jgi:hypothetical protein
LVFRRRFYFMGCFGGVLEFEVDSFDWYYEGCYWKLLVVVE